MVHVQTNTINLQILPYNKCIVMWKYSTSFTDIPYKAGMVNYALKWQRLLTYFGTWLWYGMRWRLRKRREQYRDRRNRKTNEERESGKARRARERCLHAMMLNVKCCSVVIVTDYFVMLFFLLALIDDPLYRLWTTAEDDDGLISDTLITNST